MTFPHEDSPASAMASAARFLSAPPPQQTERGGASDLSIDAVLLLTSIGWESIELVSGISIQSIPRGAWLFGKGENLTVTTAHQQALRTAERQLRDQCRSAGGHGVVGVQFDMKTERHQVMVELVGTAIRPRGADATVDDPFTSALSAKDLVLLNQSGWAPVGLCLGVSFVFVPWRGRRGLPKLMSTSFEMSNYTNALYDAREQAMERMQSLAINLGAAGIVGTTTREGPISFARHATSFVTVGTGVILIGDEHIPPPSTVLPLNEASRSFDPTSLHD